MTSSATGSTPGHAFISYVREDAAEVTRLEQLLKGSGVTVWRDTGDLWPGQDWRREIRRAITTGSLAFIACFSSNSQAREQSYQNEELLLAVDQMRLRPPGKQWFFPVRFDECELPDYELGAGRTLDSLQRSDLFGENRELSTTRLITTVVRLLEASQSPKSLTQAYAEDAVGFMKSTLLDPTKQIQLDDFVAAKTKEAVDQITDRSIFSVSPSQAATRTQATRLAVDRTNRYWDVVEPLLNILIAGCRWGRSDHYRIWTRMLRTVSNAPQELSGLSVLVELQIFPKIPLLYAGALAAVDRQDFGALKAVTVDPTVRQRQDRESIPLVAASHVYRPFANAIEATNALAIGVTEEVTDALIEQLSSGRRGRHHTPVSDYLFARLRPQFADAVPIDEDFEDLFDLTEIYLGLLATDDLLEAQERNSRVTASGVGTLSAYRDGPWFGRSSWRHRYWTSGPETSLQEEASTMGQQWPPLVAGLFGGSADRANKAFVRFNAELQQARHQRM